nr:lysine-specific histone demethylase 1 homolog 1 [Ipomoea trifida]
MRFCIIRFPQSSHSLPPQSTSKPVVSDSQSVPEEQLPASPPLVKRRRHRKRFFTHMISTAPSAAAVSGLRVRCPNPIPFAAYTYSEIDFAWTRSLKKKLRPMWCPRSAVMSKPITSSSKTTFSHGWRSNVSVWLTKDNALELIQAEHTNLINSAYNFFLHHGYINFSLALVIK